MLRLALFADSCSELDAELLTARRWDLGSNGVAEIPTADGVELIAGFGDAADAQAAQSELGGLVESVRTEWVNAPPNEVSVGGRTLTIESGQAFGHGDHASTRLILDVLPELVTGHGEQRVLDVGCGTGVVALAAAALGASEVVGLDISAEAVSVANRNAEANELTARFSLTPVADEAGGFDLILVNTLLPAHAGLANHVLEQLEGTGKVVVAGILESQRDQVLTLHAPLVVEAESASGDWICLTLRRS